MFFFLTGSLEAKWNEPGKDPFWTELTEDMESGTLYQQGALVDPISSIMDQKREDDSNGYFSVRDYVKYI